GEVGSRWRHRVAPFDSWSREFEEAPLVAEEVVIPRLVKDLHHLSEQRAVLLLITRVSHRIEIERLTTIKTPADTYFETPLGQLVKQSIILSEAQRMPEGDDRCCLADTDLRRMCSDVRSHEDRVRRQFLPLMPEVVLGVPGGPEVQLFGSNGVFPRVLHVLAVVGQVSGCAEAVRDRESHLSTFLFCEETTFRVRAKAWSWYRG